MLNIEPQPARLYRKAYLPDREVLNGNNSIFTFFYINRQLLPWTINLQGL